MSKKTKGIVILKEIRPQEVKSLDLSQEIWVNRVVLNSKLVELEITPQTNNKKSEIVRSAIISMSKQEDKDNQALFCAKMKVSDVINVFEKLESISNKRKIL